MKTANTASGFGALHLSPSALQNLKALGIHTPTPIQEQSIPVALEGLDLFGIAQTGTGKTLAFALPIFEHLEPGKQALILAPTRELAEQIEDTFRKLEFRTALLIGGAAMDRQVGWLRKKPPVLIATPGRLIDHLERRSLSLKNISVVVLDEADRMLDIGFAPAIRRILEQCPEERQTMLFSATLSDEVENIALRHMKNPVRIEIARQGTTAENVEQQLVVCEHESKHDILKELMYEEKGSMLVFTRTRHGARKIAKFTRDLGHYAVEIHSDRTLGQRREALEGFKSGRYRIMVATDVAARGIDVKDISMVINFDVPEHAEDYVHRIGRTGRAGASGKAVTFVIPQQWKEVRDIEKLISMQIPDSPHSMLPLKRATDGGNRSRSSRNLSQRNKERGATPKPFVAPVETTETSSSSTSIRPREERPVTDRPAAERFERSEQQPRNRNEGSRPNHTNDSHRTRRDSNASNRPNHESVRKENGQREYVRNDESKNVESQEPKSEWKKSDFRPSSRPNTGRPNSGRPNSGRSGSNGYGSNRQSSNRPGSDASRPGFRENSRPGDASATNKEQKGEFTKQFDQKPADSPNGTPNRKFGTQFLAKGAGPKRDSGRPAKHFKRR